MHWVNNLIHSLFASSKNETIEWKEAYTFVENKSELLYKQDELNIFLSSILNSADSITHIFQLVFLEIPQSEAFYLKTEEEVKFQELNLLFQYVISQLKSDNLYVIALQEKRISQNLNETTDEFFVYLKPRLSFFEDKHNQEFGQISCSLIQKKTAKENEYSLKIQANYYSGFNYSKPKKMEQLLHYIINKTLI